MTGGDFYPMLARNNGGYTYLFVSRDSDGEVFEDKNEMLAHIKKYIIGKGSDCNGNVGTDQDAANNIYLMRLADVYLTYTEAVMGTANSTSDEKAMKYYNMVRQRAGVSEASSVTYDELMRERRRELAFESQTWFDTQRYRYRNGDQAALDMINNGYGTGYNRCAQYVGKSYHRHQQREQPRQLCCGAEQGGVRPVRSYPPYKGFFRGSRARCRKQLVAFHAYRPR